jgi:hypothetical protein
MRFEYLLVILGVVLSFVAAVFPHYSGAYRLHPGVLVVHLMPYLMYAPAVARLSRRLMLGVGLLLVSAHGALVTHQSLVQGGDHAGLVVYLIPCLFSVLLFPLFVRAARPAWRTES